MASKYSYGASTGSPLYPLHRPRLFMTPIQSHLEVVLELVHPGNLGPLPPSPSLLASKGEQIGIAKFSEFFYR